MSGCIVGYLSAEMSSALFFVILRCLLQITFHRHDNLRLGGLVVPSVWVGVIDSAQPSRSDLFQLCFLLPSDSDLTLIKICRHLHLLSFQL